MREQFDTGVLAGASWLPMLELGCDSSPEADQRLSHHVVVRDVDSRVE